MKIEVFGPGCARCENTMHVIRSVLAELGLSADLVKVSDPAEIAARGILSTPAVVIDGRKVSEGRLPTPAMVKGWLG